MRLREAQGEAMQQPARPIEPAPQTGRRPAVAVVIPSHRVRARILEVLARIGPEVSRIYVVDDACPEDSGGHVERNCRDRRVAVLRHEANQGVGGATLTGVRQALADGADVIVKLDGDGQMDPGLIPRFVQPILDGRADYAKGNRFHQLEDVRAMPKLRLLGNAAFSFLAKISSGNWAIFDPTNGYLAIDARVAALLPFAKIERRWFFESDLLYHLYNLRAVVLDVPMQAIYGGEQSGLKPFAVLGPFLFKHLRNFAKRIFYNYYLRDFSIASIELVLGLLALGFGVVFGVTHWIESVETGIVASAGTVMAAALPIIVGVQFLMGFLNYDIQNAPRTPLHPLLDGRRPD
jgi:glycosyltransferase involved in cell wall biosynthesis